MLLHGYKARRMPLSPLTSPSPPSLLYQDIIQTAMIRGSLFQTLAFITFIQAIMCEPAPRREAKCEFTHAPDEKLSYPNTPGHQFKPLFSTYELTLTLSVGHYAWDPQICSAPVLQDLVYQYFADKDNMAIIFPKDEDMTLLDNGDCVIRMHLRGTHYPFNGPTHDPTSPPNSVHSVVRCMAQQKGYPWPEICVRVSGYLETDFEGR